MRAPPPWSPAPERLTQPRGDVHVWRARLDVSARSALRHRATLDDAERARADAYVFARDAHRFTVARGVLRALLARYTEVPAPAIRFVTGPYGKPKIDADGAAPLHFSVSHSGEIALFAFSRDFELGVDVEHARPDVDHAALARDVFSNGERAELARVDPPARMDAFYACWTRKEAYIKAIGVGLSAPLDAFSVSLAPGAPPAVIDVAGDAGGASRWTMHAFSAGDGYPCALAYRAPRATLRLLDFQDRDDA